MDSARRSAAPASSSIGGGGKAVHRRRGRRGVPHGRGRGGRGRRAWWFDPRSARHESRGRSSEGRDARRGERWLREGHDGARHGRSERGRGRDARRQGNDRRRRPRSGLFRFRRRSRRVVRRSRSESADGNRFRNELLVPRRRDGRARRATEVASAGQRHRERSLRAGFASLRVVHCVDSAGNVSTETAASGSIAILHDGGTAHIPRTAPSTLVDTDGRNYTVLYQNILPKISVRWPNAPSAGPYTLTVTSSAGKSSTYSSAARVVHVPAGALAGGRLPDLVRRRRRAVERDPRGYQVRQCSSDRDADLSRGWQFRGWVKRDRLRVLRSRDSAFPWAERISRSTASCVSRAKWPSPAGQHALAIEFVHPSRGTHYYLRRSSGH